MISFFAISPFFQRLNTLLSVKRGVYAGVNKEIRDAFENTPIEEIRNNRDMILLDAPLVVIKLRLPDRKHRLSKKDGYRLVYITYKNIDKVVFLDIYPKNGPSQQLDISDSDLLELIDVYNTEMEKGCLETYHW